MFADLPAAPLRLKICSPKADTKLMWQFSPYAYFILPVGVVSAAVAYFAARARGRALALRALRQLEVRVGERTAELAAEKDRLAGLNSVAVEIAHCLTTSEVLAAGLRLVCETVHCEAAALWLAPRGGRSRLATTPGLRTAQRRCLRDLLSSWEAPEDNRPRVLGPEGVCGLTGVAIVPLVARRISLGTLCLSGGDPAFWDGEERLSLVTGIASQIALALQNAKRYDDAQFLAERDSLTRLFNHRGLTRRVEAQVAHAAQAEQVFSVVMMDIDNFKLFNDAHGHVMGDKVLQTAARSITACLRRSDVAARCGGDEFVAILADCDDRAAAVLLGRVRQELQKRALVVDEQSIPIKMSYGIATFPTDGDGASELLAVADANLYRSKRRGGDTVTSTDGGDAAAKLPLGSFTVLDGLVTTVDTKDHYTRRHSEDVTVYAVALAAKLGLSPDSQRSLRVAGLLHDVGKVGVPDHILRKPAILSPEELVAVKQHVALGELIIKGIPNQTEVLAAISTHHERWDGEGYPRGLKGEEIPLLGRILAVADSYSAMITDRPYRPAMSMEDASDELKRVAGTQLDPHVVGAFLELLAEDYVDEERAVHLTRPL